MRRPAPSLLLALTFTTGVIDATSFLALGGVFSAMMTGNVVFLGLGLSDQVDSPVLRPLVAIGAYLAASATAALLARRIVGPAFVTRASNAVEIGLLTAASCVAAFTTVEADAASGFATLALLATAMGWRATNVRALGAQDVPTVVLNLTLIGGPAAPNSGFAGGAELRDRALAFACFLGGAIAGALLLEIDVWVPLAASVAVSLMVAVALVRADTVDAA